jgi:integrase/recombinase XerD
LLLTGFLKIIDQLAGITRRLSSPIARHTFARTTIDKINNKMIMELLGHTNLEVHQNYLKDIGKDDVLDQATDDIFS